MESIAAASGITSLTWLLIALPVAGALILLGSGRRTNAFGHLLGVATIAGSFVVAVLLWLNMLGKSSDQRATRDFLFTWMSLGRFKVDVALQLDQLSMAFVLLITGVGLLIHIYAVGYMHGDDGRRRFFGYLNLFVASMLLLVLADSFALLYVGWEGVGLASYLLIGYYQTRESAGPAAKKAFVVNRVGDIGMSVAIMVMFAAFGTVTFQGVFAAAPSASTGIVTAIGFALLLAACGKSAQFPLQSWLLDAMEGPTPVSALIHAATMVTAGVYLIARSNPIFEVAPNAQMGVIVVGVITLLAGGIIASAKDDIKKALAGSTMSAIGFMMLAVGLGKSGYVYAIAFLLAHGFFKAGLFLGAGSVMHGMNDQVNMRRFGALRSVMAITTLTFGLGYLAIIGIPPLAGYFTKDVIIESAMARNPIIGTAAVIGAGLTAFYMSRIFFMTFIGPKRWTQDVHPHESPVVMTAPMVILAIGSVTSGYLLMRNQTLQRWLEPVTGFTEPEGALRPLVLTGITLAVVALGIIAAVVLFLRRPIPETAPSKVSVLVSAARRDLYGDAFNEAVFMRPGQWLTRSLVWVDNRVIDGAVNGVAAGLGGLSARVRRTQTGYTRSYSLVMLSGALLVIVLLWIVRL
ncbi:MAG: NADH-quinone oxidoreductase subunit L [Actinomycetes bacterium]